MNIGRIVLSVFISILFTAFTLSVVSYVVREDGVIDFTGGSWGKFNLIVGIFYGVVTGTVAGIIISGFGLRIITAILFGLFFNVFLGIILALTAGGGEWSAGLTKIYYASIIIGGINGVIVSLINLWQQSLK